ncbi:MAG: chloramphenicol acetyltransferase, partial [Gemmatimonadales bacterium]
PNRGLTVRLAGQVETATVFAALEKIAWWDWPVEKITRHLELIVTGDLGALEATS